jgi:FMN phosphatase YigB (HAD superfamily)
LGPGSIHERLANSGGVLDGVYYVRRSLLTQKRNRVQAFQDMMQRYSASSENCHLFSSSKKFVVAARELGIQATHLNRNHELISELKSLL